jgi:hypothetical protein
MWFFYVLPQLFRKYNKLYVELHYIHPYGM